MKAILSTLLVIILISCNKPNDFENIDVYNERQINNFVKSLINNLSENNEVILEQQPKFCGNKLEKSRILLFPEKWIISKNQRDSLFTKEDLSFINQQINDEKQYFVYKETVSQKILNSDSLKTENLKFSNWQNKKADSLRLKNIEKLKKYLSDEAHLEYNNYCKKNAPIIYFDKPIFLKDKNKAIFSFYFYAGFVNARQETALYEYKKGKWQKIVILNASIS